MVDEDADEVEEVEEQVVAEEEVVDLHAELVVREGRLIHEYAIFVSLYLSDIKAKCLIGQKKKKKKKSQGLHTSGHF